MHTIVEDRLMASVFRRWQMFNLPDRPATEAINDGPDKRYKVDHVPLRQFLDIGCRGINLSRLAEVPLPPERYLGLHDNAAALTDVRTRYPDYTFCVGSGPAGWGHFDRILDASFHRPDFATLYKALRPLGWLGILLQTQQHPAPTQRYFLSAASLRAELKEAGFSRIDLHGVSPPDYYLLRNTSALELRTMARNFFKFAPPDTCSYLIARARKYELPTDHRTVRP